MKRIIFLIMLGVIIVGLIVLGVYSMLSTEDKTPENQSTIIDTIEGFGYTLDDRDTKLMKDEFANLKRILTASEIDYDAYTLSLAKLFVIDFYTLNNKITKNDVGSLEYMDERIVDNFKLKAMNTIYRYLENNLDNKRTQELPEVRSILSADLEHITHKIEGENIEAIKVTIQWDYVKDLGFDNHAEIIFIRAGKKLVVVDFQGSLRT